MTAKRDPDAIVRAWIDAGPRDLPDASRYSISTTARTLPQRRPRSVLPIALGGLAVAAAVVAVAVFATLPRPAPPLYGSATLGTTTGSLEVTYTVPEGLDLSVDDALASPTQNDARRALIGLTEGGVGAYGWGPLGESGLDDFTPGARGVVIADVTDTKLHGLFGQPLGTDAATFIQVLDDSDSWDVRDISETQVDGRPAVEGRLVQTAESWTHLDTVDSEGTFIDIAHPSQLIVTDVGDALVLIQIWAGTDKELAEWIPTARELVTSIELTPIR